jgi:phage shock protein PspC (stress-responsive transcriptional regulator)
MVCSNCHREIANESNFCYLCGARQAVSYAPASPPRRLHRSVIDHKLGGVCGGLAEYWNVDPTMVRLVWALLVIFPLPLVPAFVGYIVAWIVIPKAEVPMYAPSAAQAPSGAQQAQAQ